MDNMDSLFVEEENTPNVSLPRTHRCSFNFNELKKQIKPGKMELKKLVQELTRALEDYPFEVKIHREAMEKVCRLERCVICLFRQKLVLLQRKRDVCRCKGMNKTINCLRADLNSKNETIARIDKQLSNLRLSEKINLKRINELELLNMEIHSEHKDLTEEIAQLLPQASELRGKKRDVQLENQQIKDEMKNSYNQWTIHYDVIASDQDHSIGEYTNEIKELNILIQTKLSVNMKSLNANIEQNNKDTTMKLREIKQKSRHIENLKSDIEVREKKLTKCCEERIKWMQNKTIQKETINRLNKELENYDYEYKKSIDDQSEAHRKLKADLNRYNEIIEILAEENRNLSKDLPDSELVIKNCMSDLEHSIDNVEDFHHEMESICRAYRLLELESVYYNSELNNANSSHNENQKQRKSRNSQIAFEEKAKLCQYNQLISILQGVYDENDRLYQRIVELEQIKQAKEKNLKGMDEKRNELCLQYDIQQSRLEKYENEEDNYQKKRMCVLSKIESVSYEIEMLLDTECVLQQELKKLNENTKNQFLEHDRVLRDNKTLKEKLNKLKELLAHEKENNNILEKSIEISSKAKCGNVKGIMDALKMISTQETSLKTEKCRLITEYDELSVNYNLVMESMQKFKNIIKSQEEKIEKNYRLAITLKAAPDMSCPDERLVRDDEMRLVSSSVQSGTEYEDEPGHIHPGYFNHTYDQRQDSEDSDNEGYYQCRQSVDSEQFSEFNILDFAEDC